MLRVNDLTKTSRVNARTGRTVLSNPNPPPPQTYLDLETVRTAIKTVTDVPESN